MKLPLFAWKLVYKLSQECWFLNISFSEFRNLGSKIRSSFFWLKIRTHTHTHIHTHTHTHTHTYIHTQSISSMLILVSPLVFSNLKPESLGNWFFFSDQFFEILNLNLFFRQIWVKKVEFSILHGSLDTEYLEDVTVRIQRKVLKQR